ncbi:MAG: 6-bladed beta-propeller [Candidatus Aminicenantes bacterium]|nr:6-bladed beta-propeller [Candidatus Aminicenantes bacterium]
MNKFKIAAFILFVLMNIAHAERLAVLKENFTAPFLVFDKDCIYIGDKGTFSINIYSRKDFSFLKQFGKKGEGPAEFMWIHSLQVDPEVIYVSGSGKISLFSKAGKLKREIRLDPNTGNYMFLGHNIVSISYSDPEAPGDLYNKINLVGENGKKIKEIYSTRITPIWTFKEPKNDCCLITDCVEYIVYNRKLYLGNTMKGFYFIVFNENGEKVSEIDLPYEKRPIKADEKEEYINQLAYWRGEVVKKRYNFLFPEFYPAFDSFLIADDRIYVFLHNPHPMTSKEQQIVILDLQGKLLKQVAQFVPLDAAYQILDGMFYYLTDNDETQLWELHAIKIDN